MFSLVIAEILGEQFAVPEHVVGGLVLYALGNTLIPAFALRSAPTFDAPSLDSDEPPPQTAASTDDPSAPRATSGAA